MEFKVIQEKQFQIVDAFAKFFCCFLQIKIKLWLSVKPCLCHEISSLLIKYKVFILFLYLHTGPTDNTVDDFWLMIWQQKIAVIVMVTGAVEHGKVGLQYMFL